MKVTKSTVSKVEPIEYDGYVYDIHMPGSACTFFANDILVHNTDSCFFKQNGKTNNEIEHWVENYNEKLATDFIPKYNDGIVPEFSMLEIEFEKDMERFYMGSAKKRYYGIVRETGKKYIRGLNIIRKDAPTLIKEELNNLAEHCVTDCLTVEDLTTLRNKIESHPLKELGITKSFSRRFSEYIKNIPQHLKGARFANEHLEAGITHQDNPLMFYIISHCEEDLKPRERTQVICVNDELLPELTKHPELFELDWDTFMQKQIIDQIEEFAHIDSVKIALEKYKNLLNS